MRDKQIFQATSYAAYAGIRWALLTNIVNGQLYRVATEDKVEADLVFALNLQEGLDGDSAYRLMLLSKTGIARCELLEKLWRKKVALSAESLITAILNEEVLNLYGSIPRSLLRSLVTQYPAACCGVVYQNPRRAAAGARLSAHPSGNPGCHRAGVAAVG